MCTSEGISLLCCSRYTNIGDVKNGPYFEDGMLKLKYVEGNICNSPGGPDHTSTIITFECSHDMVGLNSSGISPKFLVFFLVDSN